MDAITKHTRDDEKDMLWKQNQVGASKVFLIRCYENQVDENKENWTRSVGPR